MHRIGIIADTHGLLRPEAVAALQDVELIVHAGDIGSPDIPEALAGIAPLRIIRGNVDTAAWAVQYPEELSFAYREHRFHVVHDLNAWEPVPGDRFDVIVSGHSHRPNIERIDGVLYVNPGSAGRRRFSLPTTVALLHIDDGGMEATLIDLLRR